MQKEFRDTSQSEFFENEEEATKLLSSRATLIKGAEMVLGRKVDVKEFATDETLRGLMKPALDGKTRYDWLLLKKGFDPIEINRQS